MEQYVIKGGNPLVGEVEIAGAFLFSIVGCFNHNVSVACAGND